MYRTRKKIIISGIYLSSVIVFIILSVLLTPLTLFNNANFYVFLITSIIFLSLVFLANRALNVLLGLARRHTIEAGETRILNEFIDRLRFCYSRDDFVANCTEVLEKQGDCSVIVIDREKNYVLYNSPSSIATSEEVHKRIDRYFPVTWDDGFYFFDKNTDITSKYSAARGFFLCYQKTHVFVFCRYTRLFDLEVYTRLYEEYKRFISRTRTIGTLSEIADTTKEWEQLAITQQSFLPQKIPNIQRLKIATYYRPLVNVSGDYYSILPIDQNRTLLMLGDVSGKGLPAALIMGLVMNTVQIIEDKNDLVGVLHSVDKAIKGMHLQDKYTVLFLGIVDTERMTIRYINASMSDPIILSPSPNGYRIKPLTSNASLVGILDIGDVTVAEKRLFRGDVILMATDGVSEVMDDSGVELGDTDIFKKTLQLGAAKEPQKMVDDIVDLIMKYNGDKKLHDDVTMMIAKVGY